LPKFKNQLTLYMQKKTTFLIGILVSVCLCCYCQPSIQFGKEGYDTFLKKAKDKNKLVMVYFTGTGCSLCIKMEKQVFTVPEVYTLYNQRFINVESYDDWDKPDENIKALRKKYNIISNPTFLFLDKDGNIVHRAGYGDKNYFINVGKQASGNDNYRNWVKKIEAGDYAPELVSKYLSVELPPRLYSEDNFLCSSQTVLDNYFKSVPEQQFSSAFNWKLINSYVANPESAVFNYLIANQATFNEKYGKTIIDRKIYDVYYTYWSGNRGSASFKKAETMVRSSIVPMARLLVKIRAMADEAYKIKNDSNAGWLDFIHIYDPDIREYPHVLSIAEINSWVEAICKKHSSDREAIVSVNKWMQPLLSYPENRDYDYWHTYAQTFYLMGDKTNAINTQKKAIATGKKEKLSKEDMAELETGLKLYMK